MHISYKVRYNYLIIILFIILLIPIKAFGVSEWVYVEKVLEDDDKAIVIRRNGDAYLIEELNGYL